LDNVLSGDYSVEDNDSPYGAIGHDQEGDENENNEVIDTATGEVLSAGKSPAKYTDVANSLKTAATLDELHEAADLIRDVPNEVHREQLSKTYAEREAALK
jgi:hypothetical protein